MEECGLQAARTHAASHACSWHWEGAKMWVSKLQKGKPLKMLLARDGTEV